MLINVYRPDHSNKIVISDAKLQEYLADGWVDQATYESICAEESAVKYQEWLANPDTVQERFQMLRQARDAKISATDYLMTADYPISETNKTQVMAYRQALRDLPAQAGAPWDGGGSLTPWPTMPAIIKTNI